MPAKNTTTDANSILIRPLKNGCKVEDANQNKSIRLDNEGYWHSFRDAEHFYQRNVDGSIYLKNRKLDEESEQHLFKIIRQWLCKLPHAKKALSCAKLLTMPDYTFKKIAYQQAYPEPVVILPPDRYTDIVVQSALGCPNRRCTFCAFYLDKPYQVINPTDFETHLNNIETFYGAAAFPPQGIFLGSANSMALSQRRLMHCLERITQRFAQSAPFKRGIATFADPDFSPKRTDAQWQALQQAGLTQMVIGLETGWGELRAKLGKSGDLSKVITTVQQAKQAGIQISLTILTGVGFDDEQMHHIETANLISKLSLTTDDRLYISAFVADDKTESAAQLEAIHLKKQLQSITTAKVLFYPVQNFYYKR